MPEPYWSDDTVTLWLGDCRKVLATMPDASVDAVVTDPPYEIGFMGRGWDASGIAFNPDVWRECLRVLKPGGHLLAFGAPRAYHRMAVAIEDAGWELRDTLMWIYGCLTADAEILTERGWKHGVEVRPGERVAQWDHTTGAVTLAAVQETFQAPWDGPMRVLRNADTDQVLTPNHRVYHQARRRRQVSGQRSTWYEPGWEVAEAGELSTWNPIRLPLAGVHEGAGVGGEDYAALLGWVWTEGGFDHSGTGVRIYQSSVNADKVAEISALMDRLGPHKRYEQMRTYERRNGHDHEYTATTWFFSGELAERVRADLPGKRPTYDLLWRMTASEKRALLRAALPGDGSHQSSGAWQFFQQHEDDLVWLQTLLALMGQAGKVGMRPNRPGGAVYLRNTATTELQARHLRTAWEDYTGEVWCVRVPTGAFLARRNGKVFITGNSGFPKSLDVSKAIDKAAGATRDIVGVAADFARDGAARATDGSHTPPHEAQGGHGYGDRWSTPVTRAATEQDVRWEGWGTALKPGWEPIILARKPLAGTVAQNVQTHGTGALNIDACRIETGSRPLRLSDRTTGNDVYGDGLHGSFAAGETTQGRWPANVVFTHSASCVEGYECDAGCTVAELDRQSGVRRAGGDVSGNEPSSPAKDVYGEYGRVAFSKHRDTGGASRFFPVFRYEAKAPSSERPKLADGTAHATVKPLSLMRWLVRLVAPPGGVVLDPFAGSGTTGEACVLEGFRAVLVELEQPHAELIRRRLSKPLQPSLDLFAVLTRDEEETRG